MLINFTPENKVKSIDDMTDMITIMANKSMGLRINSAIECKDALNCLVNCRKLIKKIEEQRKHYQQPFREALNKIKYTTDSFTDRLKEIEAALLSQIDSWNKLQREKTEKISEENRAMAIAFQEEMPTYTAEKPENIKTEIGSTHTVNRVSFEIEDISKIPMEYLQVNEDLVLKLIRAGLTTIPGIKIIKTTKTVARSR